MNRVVPKCGFRLRRCCSFLYYPFSGLLAPLQVVDPSGTVIAQCSEGTGFALANIDLTLLREVRETMPVWKHRRHDLYPSMAPRSTTSDLTAQDSYQFGQVRVTTSQVFWKTLLSFAFTNKCCVVPGRILKLCFVNSGA